MYQKQESKDGSHDKVTFHSYPEYDASFQSEQERRPSAPANSSKSMDQKKNVSKKNENKD